MLHILISILRIIGIILLVILGIVVTLLLLVLFVPIRYKADAVINADQTAHAKIHWLLRMFGVDVSYTDKKLCVTAKLFWLFRIQLIPSEQKQTTEKSKNSTPVKAPVSASKTAAAKNAEAPSKVPDSSVTVSKQPNTEKPKETQASVNEMPKLNSEPVIGKELVTEEKIGFFKKIIGFPGKVIQKIRTVFEKVKYTFNSIYDKISNIKGQFDYYLELLQRDQTKQAFDLCKNELFRIVKHIFPRKISGEFVLGLEDPASTGQIYGIYCAAMMLHKNRIRMVPDFDRKIMDGHVHIKGRIRLITLVYAAIKIILDKNIRYLIKILKQKQGGI